MTSSDRLWFRSHARAWQDAIPVGNGRSGALYFGGVASDRVILNHSGCWLPVEERGTAPTDLAEVLPAVRDLLRKGLPREAEELWLRRCHANGMRYVGTDSCHPVAGLRFCSDGLGDVCRYRRWLDAGSGVAGSQWQDAQAARQAQGAQAVPWQRRVWADRIDDVVCWQQESSEPVALCVSIDLLKMEKAEAWVASTYPGIDAAGWAGHSIPLADLVTVSKEMCGDTLWLRGSYTHGSGGWLLAVHCSAGQWQDDQLRLPAAASHMVLMAMAADPKTVPQREDLLQRLQRFTQRSQPLAAQQEAHARWYQRCQLRLVTGSDDQPVEDLLAAAADGVVPMRLWQHLWNMGRSTFIASSDPAGRYPPHLQGLWTGTWNPPWFGCYTNDENVQMMHWQAVAGNLVDLLRPLRRLIMASVPAWQQNARKLFACRGVVAPLQQGGDFADHQQAEWLAWTGGAGWLCRHLWDAWLVSGETDILQNELLPLIREVIHFYDDFLVPGDDGLRHALPSVSVENKPEGWPSRWTIDATMEIAIVREVLRHGFAACEASSETVPAQWTRLYEHLPAYRINADGELAEWIHPDHGDWHEHRHLSHLYPLFPGDELVTGSAELRRAAQLAVTARLQLGQRSQTGWSLVHLAHIHARLGAGDAALACLERMLRTCVQDNLLTVHDDWRGQGLTMGGGERERGTLQLDALFGANSAMLECLIQSEQGYLALLPALPAAWEAGGAAAGLATRCGLGVDLRWGDGQAQATLTATRDCEVTVHVSAPQTEQPETIRLRKGDQHEVCWQIA